MVILGMSHDCSVRPSFLVPSLGLNDKPEGHRTSDLVALIFRVRCHGAIVEQSSFRPWLVEAASYPKRANMELVIKGRRAGCLRPPVPPPRLRHRCRGLAEG
jgi:hypothetical protein